MKNKLYAFSVITGQVFPIQEDDIKILFNYQIPITELPNPKCKRCYGRGYTGTDTKTKFHHMCQCTSKNIMEGYNTPNIVIPTPKVV